MDKIVHAKTKNLLIGIGILFFSCNLFGQNNKGHFIAAGIEVQQYPTGFLLGPHAEFGFASHHSLDVRLGYNFVDHGDQGVHQNEEGEGSGMTIGYRYYFKPDNERLFVGIRMDLWFNKIDWEDDPPVSGTSKIIVLQPTAIAGYVFLAGKYWRIAPTLAFGAEINIVEKGEPVGEGAILLWGLNVAYRF